MTIEYRVCWTASSNITFNGSTDWREWEGMADDATAEQVERELNQPDGGVAEAWSQALQAAVDGSGFEYWVETRESGSEA